MYLYWFLNVNKCTGLIQTINKEGSWVKVCGNSSLSIKFFCKSKLAQKLKSFFKEDYLYCSHIRCDREHGDPAIILKLDYG